MPIKVITEFIDIATVRVVVYVKNDAGALVEPTAVKVSIWDPDGGDPVVDGTDIVSTGKVEDGIYEYYYHKDESADAMKAGQWRGKVAVIDGSGTGAIITPGSFSFKVR
ncbi:hypothetical protein ES707_14423 [subsurface metagenome]